MYQIIYVYLQVEWKANENISRKLNWTNHRFIYVLCFQRLLMQQIASECGSLESSHSSRVSSVTPSPHTIRVILQRQSPLGLPSSSCHVQRKAQPMLPRICSGGALSKYCQVTDFCKKGTQCVLISSPKDMARMVKLWFRTWSLNAAVTDEISESPTGWSDLAATALIDFEFQPMPCLTVVQQRSVAWDKILPNWWYHPFV